VVPRSGGVPPLHAPVGWMTPSADPPCSRPETFKEFTCVNEGVYDYRKLVKIYIETQREHHPNLDFKQYYAGLLASLEQFFDVALSSPPSKPPPGSPPAGLALWMLFRATVRSYLRLTTPFSGFLEAGLIIRMIEQLGPQGETIFRLDNNIVELTKKSEETHLQLLYELFTAIYGKRDLVVTSQDLKAKGFDDSKEPRIQDYWDDL
jgi:hypothetical protein